MKTHKSQPVRKRECGCMVPQRLTRSTFHSVATPCSHTWQTAHGAWKSVPARGLRMHREEARGPCHLPPASALHLSRLRVLV